MNTTYKNQLLEAIVEKSQQDITAIETFLEGILTPSEYDQVVKRLQIIKQLKQGKTHREIAADLKVGIATVTRGSRELANGKFNDI